MRFLQVHSFYDLYLTQLYLANPWLKGLPFKEQIDAILSDGFASGHLMPPHLDRRRYPQAQLIIANAWPAQQQWMIENGLGGATMDGRELVLRQIAAFDPDVLYLTDPVTFDSRFLARLPKRPRLVLGWRHAPTPAGTDLSAFDCILTGEENGVRMARDLGARRTELFGPGFPASIARLTADQPKQWDVVFCGHVGALHVERTRVLEQVASALSAAGLKLGYFIPPDGAMPPAIAAVNQGARWGMDMFRVLASARIVLNVMVDMGAGKAGNMRYYEATGVGAFLLNGHSDEMADYFAPGREVESFDTLSELYSKVAYYLEHEDEREAIAAAGQRRCLADYSMDVRARQFEAILDGLLAPV